MSGRTLDELFDAGDVFEAEEAGLSHVRERKNAWSTKVRSGLSSYETEELESEPPFTRPAKFRWKRDVALLSGIAALVAAFSLPDGSIGHIPTGSALVKLIMAPFKNGAAIAIKPAASTIEVAKKISEPVRQPITVPVQIPANVSATQLGQDSSGEAMPVEMTVQPRQPAPVMAVAPNGAQVAVVQTAAVPAAPAVQQSIAQPLLQSTLPSPRATESALIAVPAPKAIPAHTTPTAISATANLSPVANVEHVPSTNAVFSVDTEESVNKGLERKKASAVKRAKLVQSQRHLDDVISTANGPKLSRTLKTVPVDDDEVIKPIRD